MKNIVAVTQPAYQDETQYKKITDSIYQQCSTGNYCVTLSCELEDGEDSQYPLEDILDKYYVNCTEHLQEICEGDTTRLVVEIEGSLDDNNENLAHITEVAALAGKRVFNYEEGDRIRLGIE